MKWLCCYCNKITVILLTRGVLIHLTASNNIPTPGGVFGQAHSFVSPVSTCSVWKESELIQISTLTISRCSIDSFFFGGGIRFFLKRVFQVLSLCMHACLSWAVRLAILFKTLCSMRVLSSVDQIHGANSQEETITLVLTAVAMDWIMKLQQPKPQCWRHYKAYDQLRLFLCS